MASSLQRVSDSSVAPNASQTFDSHNRPIVDNQNIELIRSHLTPEQNKIVDDNMIDRYWRATSRDVHHAVRRIKETLLWYAKEQPKLMFCSACAYKSPCSHYMHVVGRDKHSRPLIYSCMDLALNKNVEDNTCHMIAVFESAISLMDPNKGVESWCWVLDFHGFSIRDCDPRLARIFLHVASSYYPERLGNFYLVDPPVVFSTLWNAIERFIEPKTKKKVAFLSLKKEEKLRKTMLEQCNVETVDWLVSEMMDNRKKGTRGKKFYDYNALRNLGEDVDVYKEMKSEKHNNLGTPAFLTEIKARLKNSESLPPQVFVNEPKESLM